MTALITMLAVVALALSGLLPVAALAWWLLRLGYEQGDCPGDATSRITVDLDGQAWLSVANPSSTPVIVGARAHKEWRFAVPSLAPSLVVRAARRNERSEAASWSDALLGAVAPRSESQWPVTGVAARTRLVVAIGQPGRGLRIHDHLVIATAATAVWDPALADPAS